jgi:hypothetical protein
VLFLLGLIGNRAAQNFYMLGTGIALIVQNADLAKSALIDLRDTIKDLSQMNFSKSLIAQIDEVAAAMQRLGSTKLTALQILNVVAKTIVPAAGGVPGGAQPTADSAAIANKLDTSNEHLNAIRGNTKTTNDLLNKIIATSGGRFSGPVPIMVKSTAVGAG